MPLSSCAASPRNRTPALSSVCSRAVRTATSPMCADYESRRESRWRPASGHLSRSVRRCGKPGPIFVVQGPHKVAEVLRRKEQARRLIFGELNDLGPMLRPFGDRLLHQGFQHERRGAHPRPCLPFLEKRPQGQPRFRQALTISRSLVADTSRAACLGSRGPTTPPAFEARIDTRSPVFPSSIHFV